MLERAFLDIPTPAEVSPMFDYAYCQHSCFFGGECSFLLVLEQLYVADEFVFPFICTGDYVCILCYFVWGLFLVANCRIIRYCLL